MPWLIWIPLLLSLAATESAFSAPPGRVSSELRARLEPAPPAQVRVTVALRRGRMPRGLDERRPWIAARQDRVLSGVGAEFRATRRYGAIAALAGVATPRGVERLAAHPDVESVSLDVPLPLQLGEGRALIGADAAFLGGFHGDGVTVAVLDTGIDTDHPAFDGDLLAEACFCDDDFRPQFGCCPGGGPTQSGPGSAEDLEGHGTAATGIITAQGGGVPRGVAPAAGIVAVRVAGPSESAATSDVAAGLDWVLANHDAHGIRVVNLSLGSTQVFDDAVPCSAVNPGVTDAIADLTALGIAVVAASGNAGDEGGVAFPACIPGAIAVGGTYDADFDQPIEWCVGTDCDEILCVDDDPRSGSFVCHTNSGTLLDLLAPDFHTRTALVGGGITVFSGTSAAAPYVAAQAALLLEADPTLAPSEILALLAASGPLVTNPESGLSWPRSNVAAALTALSGALDADADGTSDVYDNCVEVPNADQRDVGADGYGNACDPDYTDDGAVGLPDFNALSAAFGASEGDPDYDAAIDADSDGVIGIPDFSVLRTFFGGAPGPSGLACAGAAPCTAP